MSKVWKIAGIATLVALLGALLFAGVIYAEDPTPTGRIGRGLGWMGERLGGLRDAIASKLGVETEDLDTAMQEAHQEMIEQAVADGSITQEQADRMLSRAEDGLPFGKMGHRGGRGRGISLGLNQADALAEKLGLSLDELQEKLSAGETLSEIAEAQGVDLEEVQEALSAEKLEAQKANIQQAVEDGKMTQEQADWMLQGIDQGFMPMRGGARGGRGGRFGGCWR